MIPLAQNKLEKARQHALKEYPFECCGIIIGRPDSDREDILFRCTNIQNKLHEMDPEKFENMSINPYFFCNCGFPQVGPGFHLDGFFLFFELDF